MINQIIHADCLEVMGKMEDNSISCIFTDPPYGLHFMGKDWDHGIPGEIYWKEAYRIAKRGSFLLSFGGTRTYHRLTSSIEDSGWEIRDCLMWIYGSGFPKSHNNFGIEGYGTALKPAYEPIIMAMKPCDGTFAQNVEKWGQGGINIDGCRIGNEGATKRSNQEEYPKNEDGTEDRSQHWARTGHQINQINKGRWPANVLFDEEAAMMLDEQSGLNVSRFFYCAKTSSKERNEGLEGFPLKNTSCEYGYKEDRGREGYMPPSPKQNNHPTVKPLKLMEYLIKLVMPPKDGILLDPFAGSGTTILAAKRLGFNAIGIEKSEEYCKIAAARVDSYIQQMEMF